MHLTPFQRRVLQVYRWYHQHPPAWRFYLTTMMWRSSYQIYLGIVGIAVLLLLISRTAAIGRWIDLLLGILIGIIIRAMLSYRQTIRLWPVFDSIIDWGRVEALLEPQPSERTEGHDPT